MGTLSGGGAARAWGLPTDPSTIAVYLGLSLMLVLVHAYRVNLDPRNTGPRIARHQQIVRAEGESPFVYRVAVPNAAAALAFGLRQLGVKPIPALETAYLTLRWTFILAALLLFHAFLSTWFAPPWTLAGTFLFAALHPASFFFYFYQPASALDLVLWLLAALISLRDRGGAWLIPIAALGTLNRETVVFIAAIHFALRYGREPFKPLLMRCVAIGAASLATFVALRAVIGSRAAVISVAEVMEQNLESPMWWIFALAFFGALWVLPFRSWRAQAPELRRLAIVLIPYLILQLAFGRVREVRLILPLAMPLIPLALARLRASSEDALDDDAGPTWPRRA